MTFVDAVQPTANRKQKNKKATSKKEGVQMTMKFRNHQDPLYYDPKSNDKIFVPVIQEVCVIKLYTVVLPSTFLCVCFMALNQKILNAHVLFDLIGIP